MQDFIGQNIYPSSQTIAIVAGEVSGDILGAGLIRALKQKYPHAHFIGIAGPQMLAEGCKTLIDMEEIAVMGLVEILKHLPRLLKIRRQTVKNLIALKPDIFIGIDSPEFNLYIEEKLKNTGIKTIHYVSPSVWAWRQNRIHKIARATDLVLAFLPFEKAFYDKFKVPCRFVGHTMADSIPLIPSRTEACKSLGIAEQQRYVAILVGSRSSEVDFLTVPFIEAAVLLKQRHPDLKFLLPLISPKRQRQFEQILADISSHFIGTNFSHEDLILLDGKARQAMIVSEVTLLASGTAALECMLCKSPMVVGYRMKPLTYYLAKWLVKTPYVSLPNLLANEMLVPEMLQEDCQPEKLASQMEVYLGENATQNRERLIARFKQLHQQIQCNADMQAAQAVIEILENKS